MKKDEQFIFSMLSIRFQNLNHEQIGKRFFIDSIGRFDPEPKLLLSLIICSMPWCRRHNFFSVALMVDGPLFLS